jgi:hypothetical protein
LFKFGGTSASVGVSSFRAIGVGTHPDPVGSMPAGTRKLSARKSSAGTWEIAQIYSQDFLYRLIILIFNYNLKQTNMSNFIQHIKLATENIVLISDTGISKKEHYGYAEKMEKMLKRQLKEELDRMIDSEENTNELLEEFIQKLEK